MLRKGINGSGRMGQLAFRIGFHDPGLEFVQINEIFTDSAGSAHPSVVDALSTMVIDTKVKLYAWYASEWGYANRLIDLVRMVARNG